jgi:hypothetical protein
VEDLELVKAANPSSRITVETLAAKRARPSWSLAALAAVDVQHADPDGGVGDHGAGVVRGARTDETIPAGRRSRCGRARSRLEVRHDGDGAVVDPDRSSGCSVPATILEPPRNGDAARRAPRRGGALRGP